MPLFTEQTLQALRQKIDLVDALSPHIELKRQGAGFKALCPFHDEKSPSFVINKGDTHYHCFGCGAHGDAISFLMQHQRLSFNEAVERLAERFSVPVDYMEKTRDQKTVSRSRLKDLLDNVTSYYEWALLHTKEGHIACDYLKKRFISLDCIAQFRIGYSPKGDGIRAYMHKKGFSDAEMIETGVLNERKKPFFSDRVLFPVIDETGAVIGFTARKFKEETFGGKYINTKETPLFKKSRVLFGLHDARKRIIKEKQAIVVEGGLDCLRMLYFGFTNTVAALGTAFGQEHVDYLAQLGVEQVFLLFDGDDAGKKAQEKVGNLFMKKGIDVYVSKLGAKDDPDTLLVRYGPVAIAKALFDAKEYLSFLYDFKVATLKNPTPAEKDRVLTEVVQTVRSWESPVLVHESLKKLASISKIPEELLGVGSQVMHTLYKKRTVAVGTMQVVDPNKVLEQDLLRWLILYGHTKKELFTLCRDALTKEDFTLDVCKKIYEILYQMLAADKPIDMMVFANDDEMQTFLSELLEKKVNPEKALEHVKETIFRIQERNWMLLCDAIDRKIKTGGLDEKEMVDLVQEFAKVKKERPKK